jgi:hypothetical protein
MKQHLGEPAIQHGGIRAAVLVCPEQFKTGVNVPGAERRREGISIDQAWGRVSIEIHRGGIPE